MNLDNVSLKRFYTLFNNSLDLLEQAVAEGKTDFAIAFLCNYHQFNLPYLAPNSGLSFPHAPAIDSADALEEQNLLLEADFWQSLTDLIGKETSSTNPSSDT